MTMASIPVATIVMHKFGFGGYLIIRYITEVNHFSFVYLILDPCKKKQQKTKKRTRIARAARGQTGRPGRCARMRRRRDVVDNFVREA